ncbi:unnamed protein product [Owenia fusiformis]|uniref:EF-hand domain-containing protein n=1 Tax=Owenia fusiformis TaxID=6347 RepID=A0A8S4Q3V4_OWEFU|nr:unnamed protein product [Owenia fusiformis]
MADSVNISSNIQIRQLPLTWMRKIITAIQCFDKDKDGVAGPEDHMVVADNLVREGNLTGEARDDMYRVFKDYCDLGASQDIPSSISLADQLVSIWKCKDNPETIEIWLNIFSKIFECLCMDSSGFMTFDNYMIFWNGMSLDKRFARMQFDYMDTNGDGLISQEEFANASVEFTRNTDETTLNRFLGPLINY